MDLTGKQAIVTGGGSGIGLSIARAFAEAGASVVVTGRTDAKLRDAARSHPRITPFVCDVTDDAAVIALKDAMDARGGTDVLVNNAGVMHAFDVRSGFSLDAQLQEIDIDAAAPVRLVHHFLPGMLGRPSAIVNVSSALAFVPAAGAPVYSASKAFLHSYTQSLRGQLAGTSVRVVELMPPVVDTDMAAGSSGPAMSTAALTAAFMKGFREGAAEITPGQAGQLKWLQRLAPGFAFRKLQSLGG